MERNQNHSPNNTQGKNTEKKRINQSRTAIKSYYENLKAGLFKNQSEIVKQYLLAINKPCTNRGINKGTGIEITALSRTLYNMRNEGIAYVVKEAKSDFTDKTVHWYGIVGVDYGKEDSNG